MTRRGAAGVRGPGRGRAAPGALRALLLACAVSAASCAADHGAELEALWGGPAGLAALQSDGPVSVVLLDPAGGPQPLDSPTDAVVREPARALSPATARALRTTLARQGSYLWDVAKGCLPSWGVRLELRGPGPALDVLLCLECDILAVAEGGAWIGGEDFDPVRGQLVAAVQEAFPGSWPP